METLPHKQTPYELVKQIGHAVFDQMHIPNPRMLIEPAEVPDGSK